MASRAGLTELALTAGLVVAPLRVAALPPDTRDLQERIREAQARVLPATVHLQVIGQELETGAGERRIWQGSGILISSSGLVATNHHVLDKALRVRAMLSDRRSFEGEVLGTDRETDLGLLRLRLAPGHTPLPFALPAASPAVNAGDIVLAVGSPLGLTRSVSFGIINNPAQALGDEDLYNWIQTDAAINPGNSGGPLVDLDGRVVGINTAGFLGTGIGLSVPADAAFEVFGGLARRGRISRCSVGLSLQALRDFKRDTVVEGDRGVLITGVKPGSPAAAAGLLAGDLLLSADGRPTDGLYAEDMPAIRRLLASLPAGAAVPLTVRRHHQALEVLVVPAPRQIGGELSDYFQAEDWMMTVRDIREDEDSQARYYRRRGCVIASMLESGNASRSGLSPEDILLRIDGREIESLEDVRASYAKAVERPAGKRRLLLSVLRRGRQLLVALDYRRSKAEQEADR